jgi:hypothetical protein
MEIPARRCHIAPVAVAVIHRVEVHHEDLGWAVTKRQLHSKPDFPKCRSKSAPPPVEHLRELLGNRAPTRVWASRHRCQRGAPGAFKDVDQWARIQVLILDRDDRCAQLPGRRQARGGAVMEGEQALHACGCVTDSRQAEHVQRPGRQPSHDQREDSADGDDEAVAMAPLSPGCVLSRQADVMTARTTVGFAIGSRWLEFAQRCLAEDRRAPGRLTNVLAFSPARLWQRSRSHYSRDRLIVARRHGPSHARFAVSWRLSRHPARDERRMGGSAPPARREAEKVCGGSVSAPIPARSSAAWSRSFRLRFLEEDPSRLHGGTASGRLPAPP